MGGDDRSWMDREKRSFSELDRLRRERRSSGERRPQGKAAQERAQAATKQYMKEIDGLFSQGNKAELERITTAMRDAHGTPGLADACRVYHQTAGLPDEAPLMACHVLAHVSEIGWEIASTSTQVQGGIGWTDEQNLHFWFKRIGNARHLLGGPEYLRNRAAELQGFAAAS